MRTYRTPSLLTGLAVALAVTALGAVPAAAGTAAARAAAARAASVRHAPPVGRQLAVLNGSGADRYSMASKAGAGRRWPGSP